MLATPVATLASLLGDVWRAAPDGIVITDVGSTKAAIVRTAEELARTRPLAFVGSTHGRVRAERVPRWRASISSRAPV